MMQITAYDRITGRITGVYSAILLDDCLIQIDPATEDWIEGAFDPGAHRIVAGLPVAIPPRPGDWAVWDWQALAWTDPRDAAFYAAQLSEARTGARARITDIRGRARLAFITDIPGQDLLYQTKREEAQSYLQDPAPQPVDYPLLMSEVGVTAPTAYEVAQVFLNLNAVWRQAAAAIDSACFSAEAAIASATDAVAVDTIVTALVADLAALVTIYGGQTS